MALSSSFDPGKPLGLQLHTKAYSKIARLLKIDPVREGHLLQVRVSRLLLNDIMALKNPSEREKRRKEADRLTRLYAARLSKFLEVFMRWNHLGGQERAIGAMTPFIKDAEEQSSRIKKSKERLLAAD